MQTTLVEVTRRVIVERRWETVRALSALDIAQQPDLAHAGRAVLSTLQSNRITLPWGLCYVDSGHGLELVDAYAVRHPGRLAAHDHPGDRRPCRERGFRSSDHRWLTAQFVTGRLVNVNGVVRVVSWNLAFGKPGAYKSYSNRRRQWALLGALAPDIALLQECRPSDLQDHAPGWMAEEYSVAGTLQPGWKLCSTILVRKPHTVVVLDRALLGDDQRRWLDHMSGYVAAATVFVGTCAMEVASVHALAEEVKVSEAVALADHERIRRAGLDRAMHNDLAVAALGPWVADRRFIVGGDWNDSPLFDVNYPKGAIRGPRGKYRVLRTTHCGRLVGRHEKVPRRGDPNLLGAEVSPVRTRPRVHRRRDERWARGLRSLEQHRGRGSQRPRPRRRRVRALTRYRRCFAGIIFKGNCRSPTEATVSSMNRNCTPRRPYGPRKNKKPEP